MLPVGNLLSFFTFMWFLLLFCNNFSHIHVIFNQLYVYVLLCNTSVLLSIEEKIYN